MPFMNGATDGKCRVSTSIIVDCSTSEPTSTDRIRDDFAKDGIAFVDAPLARTPKEAELGKLNVMVGADPDVFARIKPMLEAMGTTIHHCGPAGAGMRTKLVNNYLAIISCQLNAEAIALSQRFGLSLEKSLDVIHGTTATNGQLKLAWPLKVLKGDVAPGFTIDLAHKDLTLIVEAANAAKVPVPIAAVAREAFSAARAEGHGAKDFSAMVDALCERARAGVRVHRDCHVQFEKALYSVPFTLVGRDLWLRATDTTVSVYEEHRLVALHLRARSAGTRRTVSEHLPPEAREFFAHDRHWCLTQAERVGPACVELIRTLFADRILERLRAAQGVLRLAEQFGATRLEAACARALAHASPHYRTVKTILARGFDQRVDLGAQHSPAIYAAEARFVRPADTLFASAEPPP